MNSVISKGKNVNEAIYNALSIMNKERAAVDIEVVATESRGVFGFGGKPAVVRVTEKSLEYVPSQDSAAILEGDQREASSNDKSDRLLDVEDHAAAMQAPLSKEMELGGKAWVTDGRIYCKDKTGEYPRITPASGMKLHRNAVLEEQTIAINEADHMEVELLEEESRLEWDIWLDAEKMNVFLQYKPGVKISRSLKDHPPAAHIKLKAQERRTYTVLESALVYARLRELGVNYGIDNEAILKTVHCETECIAVIAKGLHPKSGQNGSFTAISEAEIKKGIKEREDGSVDFRELVQFPSVQAGQCIGTITPPEEGEFGVTVTGEQIAPQPALPVIVQPGKGVTVIDNDKVVAFHDGHPEITVKGQLVKISVVPKIVIPKDVSIETGNVRYSGEVEIAGSVNEGMTVEAGGNISAGGHVNQAVITAGKSVVVRHNIISSRVSSGNRIMLQQELASMLHDISSYMKQIAAAIEQLSKVSSLQSSNFEKTGLGPLIKILSEGKFKAFPPSLRTFLTKVNENLDWLDHEWKQLIQELCKAFVVVHSSSLRSLKDLQELIVFSDQLYSDSQLMDSGEQCLIQAGIVHQSELYSSGDIYIVNQGVYNSKLVAGGSIRIEGYLRGGEVQAGHHVSIGEAGARGGIHTKISVPEKGEIRLQRALEDTIIQVGSITHCFTAGTSEVYARLDETGQLILH